MVTAMLVFVGTVSVMAQPDNVLTYREYRDDPVAFQAYLAGAYDGFGWANATLREDGQDLLFCQPTSLGLSIVDMEAALNSYMIGQDALLDYPVNMLALFALRARFPC